MVFPDVNVLIYAMRADLPHHEEAYEFLSLLLASSRTVLWHPMQLAAVVRITTHPKFTKEPSTLEQCAEFLDAFLSSSQARRAVESDQFWASMKSVLEQTQITGSRVSDVYWATLCKENNATIATFDRTFPAVKGVRILVMGAGQQ